jgi:molybdopterin synthase sulfur carrier subunit
MAATRVTVLYFGGLRDAIGLSEEALELPGDVRTVGDLSAHLAARHRAYGDQRACVRLARNEAFAGVDERLESGDVIALLPPVAGG